MTREEYMTSKLDRLIVIYEGKRDGARLTAVTLKALVLMLGTSTTILLGLREFPAFVPWADAIGVTTLILSACVTAATAWESFANYIWRWAYYRQVLSQFLNARDRLRFRLLTDPTLPGPVADDMFNQMMAIIDAANGAWEEKRAPALRL